jgi:hypothetical protein
MLGIKRCRDAAMTISGVELMHRIRKGQFNLARLRPKDTVLLFGRQYDFYSWVISKPTL